MKKPSKIKFGFDFDTLFDTWKCPVCGYTVSVSTMSTLEPDLICKCLYPHNITQMVPILYNYDEPQTNTKGVPESEDFYPPTHIEEEPLF